MQFFLYEIVARIVAIYLVFDCGRVLWRGLVERKIRYFTPDVLNWLFFRPDRLADRDAAPVQYWTTMGIRTIVLLACLLLAIFGWWHPDAVPEVRQ